MIAAAQSLPVQISRRKIISLVHNNAKSAEAIKLVYVNDKQKGISRLKKGKSFIYKLNGKQITDEETIFRIRRLVLPPAWKDVWICASDDGHLQATGVDALGRKQYRYHPLWNKLRSEAKFFNLLDFGKTLPAMRKQLRKDLLLPGLPLQKVLAVIVSLMEQTGVRIGSNVYEKLYGSFGLTTLHDQHVKITGNEVKFSFKGKKGVYQNIALKSKKLAIIVAQCRDIPGRELFQYYDEHEVRHSIESGIVNDYIKNICGQNFTAKNFRTWVGTACALEAFRTIGGCDTITETKRKIVEVLDIVAKRLGNTRTVCKKYYVHPAVIDFYTNKTIEKYFKQAAKMTANQGLSIEEQILMKMLEKVTTTTIES